MNKKAIENFAIWARNKLIADISYKAGLLGVTDAGIKTALPQSTSTTEFYDIGTTEPYVITGEEIKQRRRLVDIIEKKATDSNYATAYSGVIEEVAYTWFNRLIAIRFMEVNDYLPSHLRVLSSESGKMEPDLVTTPFDAELELTQEEKMTIMSLKNDNKVDELFNMLFIKQCNALNEILPNLFEKTSDYTELLLNLSVIDKEGVVYHLLNDIDEDDFNVEKEGQVEILGWLYQYYISEKHDQIINIYKGTVKKEDIPAATQLFTTDWVVRYMVDNSLGRYWIERNPNSKLAEKLEFFVTPKEGNIDFIDEKVDPTDIKFFDPCMGSGHILVYAFDVYMEIYRECGYSDRDAALKIIENNIYGIDIDERAYQLAYFAVMMKARSYNRRIFRAGSRCNVAAVDESNGIDKFECEGITNDLEMNQIGNYLIKVFRHAKEIGSLQTVEKKDYAKFIEYLDNISTDVRQLDMFSTVWLQNVVPLMRKLAYQAEILSNKYAVVSTNPPYMGKLEGNLKRFVIDNYKDYSGDLFSVFMYRNFAFCEKDGYTSFMTPFVWMFIKTYESLRKYIINNKALVSLIQMEYSAFEEATVPICSFVLQNCKPRNKALCFRLSDFPGGMEVQKQKVLEALNNKECGWYFEANQKEFLRVSGNAIAYWISENTLQAYENPPIEKYMNCKSGIATGSDKYILHWYEPNIGKIRFDCKKADDMEGYKWFPLNSGGEFRKWYGNNLKLVNLWNGGIDIKTNVKNYRLRDSKLYFKKGITWGRITSSQIAFREIIDGSLFGDAGPIGFVEDENLRRYLLGFLCSKVVKSLLQVTNPTLNFQIHDIMDLPLALQIDLKERIVCLVSENINISRMDWDSFEISWEFEEHPFVRLSKELWDATEIGASISYYFGENIEVSCPIEMCYKLWQGECNERFKRLKENEEELNRIFMNIYGLQNELTPDVEDKDVTVCTADLLRDMRSFISYAVGCIFGRYSLDENGLIYASGQWNDRRYDKFIPDEDNIIPITDEEYFEDDIVGLFCDWLKVVYGEETLEENLDFIANALGCKGNTSREVIRNYFLKDFFKDHCKTYQKRPIYWLFDSGKQNGFKALVYLHRYNADTIGNMRVDYLHRMQRIYESESNRMQDMIDNSTNSREVGAATKRKEKLQKQLKECREYDEKIGHLALSRIELDLDDGVKVNYEKVQTAPDGKKYQVLEKIK